MGEEAAGNIAGNRDRDGKLRRWWRTGRGAAVKKKEEGRVKEEARGVK